MNYEKAGNMLGSTETKQCYAERLEQRYASIASSQAQETPAASLIDQEYQRLCEAIAGLDSSVMDLLTRIAPVLQPGKLLDSKDANGQGAAIESTPSETRSKLIKARQWVETISAKIAPVRYTIEL